MLHGERARGCRTCRNGGTILASLETRGNRAPRENENEDQNLNGPRWPVCLRRARPGRRSSDHGGRACPRGRFRRPTRRRLGRAGDAPRLRERCAPWPPLQLLGQRSSGGNDERKRLKLVLRGGPADPGTRNVDSEGDPDLPAERPRVDPLRHAAESSRTPTFDPSLPVSPGFFAGWVTINHTIVQSDADHFTSSGTNAFSKTDATVYRTGCSTAVGQRFK